MTDIPIFLCCCTYAFATTEKAPLRLHQARLSAPVSHLRTLCTTAVQPALREVFALQWL
jgi:hypothetical protein